MMFARLCNRLAVLVACLAAGVAPSSANTRDLRGLVIPASACIESGRSAGLTEEQAGFDATFGFFFLHGQVGVQRTLVLRCPLPFGRIGRTETKNVMTSFRVHADNPGTGGSTNLNFFILTRNIVAKRSFDSDRICQPQLPIANGGPKRFVFVCNHTFEAGAQYWFAISLNLLENTTTKFYGIDFPASP